MRRLVTALAMLALLGTASCGAAPDDSYRMDALPSGVPHAINQGTEAWSEAERWTAELALEIGEIHGDGPDVFGSVAGFRVDDAGNLYVLDYQANELRAFDPEGKFLRAFGRSGEGPGEFTRANGLNLSPNGELWVWDPGAGRFTIFDSEGEYLREVRRLVSGVIFPWLGGFDGRGRMIDWGLEFPDFQPGTPGGAGATSVFYPIAVDESDGSLDTLPALRYETEVVGSLRRPFGTSMTVHQAGDDVWFALTREYTVYRRTLVGDTLLAISLADAVPAPVTDAEVDSIVRRYAESPIDYDPEITPDDVFRTKRVVRRLVTDGAGHLLVIPELDGQPAGTVVDVFLTDTGEYLGRVHLPVRIELSPAPIAVGGSLYALSLGALDVPVVVRIEFSSDG